MRLRPRGSLGDVVVWPMTDADLPTLIDVQQAGAVLGMAAIFPQDTHPFPRDAIVARWREEIGDPTVDTYVAVDDGGHITGFAATTGSELLHFGTAVETWGDGTAHELHDVVVDRMCAGGGKPVLYVFAENHRARRFYEKHGWRPTGASHTSGFAPHPLLLEYALHVS